MENQFSSSATGMRTMYGAYQEMQKMDADTKLVVALQFSCALQGRERPGEKVIDFYRSLLPILSDTLDRVADILHSDSLPTGLYTIQMVAEIRGLFKELDWRENIILSWLDDEDEDDDGPSQAYDPVRPSGVTRKQPVAAV